MDDFTSIVWILYVLGQKPDNSYLYAFNSRENCIIAGNAYNSRLTKEKIFKVKMVCEVKKGIFL